MSCTVCGSNTPCNCPSLSGGVYGRCCGVCGSTNCSNPNNCCSASGQATPLPYYACAGASPQSHTKQITILNYAASVKVLPSWNIPACGESAVIYVEALKSIVPGSYLWNPAFGYFEVTAFDSSNGQVTVVNHCNSGNAAQGTLVPGCTEFTITVTPCVCPIDGQVCVAIDFTAPEVGDCIDITLTSTQGIAAGSTVQIGSGFYSVAAVKPNDIIEICNNGEGITPGTAVIAKNSAGEYQYCLGIIATNVCDQTPVDEGRIIVCNAGTQNVIESNIPGEGDIVVAPILNGTDLETAEYTPLDVDERICTTLTSALTIVGAQADYTINVNDTAGFTAGMILSIQGRSETFQLTAVGAGTFDITAVPTPGAGGSVASGSWVCQATCCVRLSEFASNLGGFATSYDALGTISVGSPTIQTPTFQVVVTNPSLWRNAIVGWCVRAGIDGLVSDGNTDPPVLAFRLKASVDPDPLLVITYIQQRTYFASDAGLEGIYSQQVSFMRPITTIPPNTSITLNVAVEVEIFAGSTAEYIVANVDIEGLITQIAV